jgi:hypothetical protein
MMGTGCRTRFTQRRYCLQLLFTDVCVHCADRQTQHQLLVHHINRDFAVVDVLK